MATHVVLDDFESMVIHMGLEWLKSASPLLDGDEREIYQIVIDGLQQKIDTAEKQQNPIIEV